jgi:peptidoglycan/xylan/chitin deacetylase (PgdA/CDA1 family)
MADMKHLLIRICLATALFSTCTVSVTQAASSAVILMYHRFGESDQPLTNTTVVQLEDHITALQNGGYTVVSLADVLAALDGEISLPPRAVAITVDDAYRSFLMTGWPRFKAAGYSVTLFVATKSVNAGYSDFLTWDELRALQQEGVEIGAHSHGHGHYPLLSTTSLEQDLGQMAAAFDRALGTVPRVFAYPYGEAGLSDMAAVRAALNEQYGAADRFRLVIGTLPLPVKSISPADPVLQSHPSTITLNLVSPPQNLKDVTCFGPAGDPLQASVYTNSLSINPISSFPTGRVRLNCTLQSVDRSTQGRWHWFGWQMISGFESEGVAVHPRYR